MFRSLRRVRESVSALVVVVACIVILGVDARPASAAAEAVHWEAACRLELAQDWEREYWRLAWQERAHNAFAVKQEREREAVEREQERVLREYRMALHRDDAQRRLALRRIEDLVPEQYRGMVLDAAERYDLDPRVLAAIGTVESNWNSRALGTHQDTGLMQILPSTARWIASRMKLAQYDLYDPATNLNMAAFYLRALLHDHGTLEAALAVYNGGPRAASKGAAHPYTKRVLAVYGRPAP